MFNLVKWAYDIGKKHERRRIELAIREYRHQPMQHFGDDEERKQQEVFGMAVEAAIHGILFPTRSEIVEKSVFDD